jgi:RNA polymerase sigma-70 factor (ECF subfamily)
MRGLASMEMAAPEAPVRREDGGPLLAAHGNGDREAFPKLVQQYRKPVYGYLFHCGVPEPDRDDLFQEIFVRVHQRARSYDPSRPLHPWLFTVVANSVRTYFRKQNRRLFFFAGPPPEDVKDEAPDGEALFSARETTDWLERAIQALPLSQREVLVLATLENLPMNEIASILELPVNTVKTQLRRARLRLMESYERRTRVTS